MKVILPMDICVTLPQRVKANPLLWPRERSIIGDNIYNPRRNVLYSEINDVINLEGLQSEQYHTPFNQVFICQNYITKWKQAFQSFSMN